MRAPPYMPMVPSCLNFHLVVWSKVEKEFLESRSKGSENQNSWYMDIAIVQEFASTNQKNPKLNPQSQSHTNWSGKRNY